MQITFLWLGKSKYKSYTELESMYAKRLKHYCRHEILGLKEIKQKGDPTEIKKKEAELFLSQIADSDYVVLLDERGKSMSSMGLSTWLQKRMNAATNRVVFIIGGSFGVDQSLFDRANYTWSLSELTMTHDMARLLLLEQIYRGYTILRGEKYHNE